MSYKTAYLNKRWFSAFLRHTFVPTFRRILCGGWIWM